MKRRVIKEVSKSIYAIDIMVYAIMAVVGYLLLSGTMSTTVDVEDFVVSTFFIFGFFSLLGYFLNRREDDYEFLLFGEINVFVAIFVMASKNNGDMNFVISCSLMVFAVTYLINKLLSVFKLFKKKSINFIPKCAIAIITFILSILAVFSLYKKIEVAYMIYGYYFIVFGLLGILEVLLIILMNGKSFKKKMLKFLDYKEEKKEVRKKVEIKKMKRVSAKRITPKKVSDADEVEQKEEIKKENKKKKTKKK